MEIIENETLRRKAIESYFSTYGHVRDQLEGYEDFMGRLLPAIVGENSELVIDSLQRRVRHCISFGDGRGGGVTIRKPQMTESDGATHKLMPAEARFRALTYASSVCVDVTHVVTQFSGDPGEPLEEVINTTEHRRLEVPLFSIPTMVKSKFCNLHKATHQNSPTECPYDPGGYFLINGHEKVLVSQSKLRTNIAFIWSSKGKRAFEAEVRSCHETKWRSTSTLRVVITTARPPEILVLVPFIMRGSSSPLEVPLAAIARVLGLDADSAREVLLDEDEPAEVNDIIETVCFNHAMFSMSRDDILTWIGNEGTKERTAEKKRRTVDHIFLNEVLPHCGMADEPVIWRKKAHFLGMAVRRLVSVYLGREYPDDRDHNSNKRLDGPGPLLAILFRQLFRNNLKAVRQGSQSLWKPAS